MVTRDQGRFGGLVLVLGATFVWPGTFGWGQAAPAARPCVGTDGKVDGSCAAAGKDGAGKVGAGAPKVDSGGVEAGAAQRFPYPGEGAGEGAGESAGESSGTVAPDAPAKAGVPDAPAAPGAGGEKTGAAGAFPYPGESGSGSGAGSAPGTDSGGSGSSSSSSSGPDGSGAAAGGPGLDDVGSEGSTRATRRKLPKPERIQSDEDRATEDMTVAKFYQQTGNLQAAYLRAKDAVKMQPADAETHFVLAGVLEKMRRREEAVAEFDAYLKLDPDGQHEKAARKAIAGK